MGFVKENARSRDNLPFLILNVKNIIHITSSTGKPKPVFIPADSSTPLAVTKLRIMRRYADKISASAPYNYVRNTIFSIAETVIG